ncbi:DNRLRE domain-containing protein [Candidatus Parcubacteria bacterium]|nr:MAG: DNRLRE domain-containing protein [Candidatus Parcubacteria bacterium]
MVTVSLYSIADARILNIYPSNNFGTQPEVDAGYYVAGAELARSFIKFDLSSIPAGSTISAATLSLTIYLFGVQADTHYIYRVTGSWTETGVSWGNQPGYTTTNGASLYVNSSGTKSWNVLGIVRDWIENGYTNYGFLWRVAHEGWTSETVCRAYSREYSSTAIRLDVTYTPPAGRNFQAVWIG